MCRWNAYFVQPVVIDELGTPARYRSVTPAANAMTTPRSDAALAH